MESGESQTNKRLAAANAYLSVALSFLTELGQEGLKEVPVLRALVAAWQRFQDEAARDQMINLIEDNLTLSRGLALRVDQLTDAVHTLALPEWYDKLMEHGRIAPGSQQALELAEGRTELALAAYRTRVERELQYVDYRGVSPADLDPAVSTIPLLDVFIEPHLCEEGLPPTAAELSGFIGLMHPEDDHPTEQQQFRTASERAQKHPLLAESRQPLSDVMRRKTTKVVLGGPGIGKSTMIRYLAVACVRGEYVSADDDVQYTPLRLELAAFARYVRRTGEYSLTRFAEQYLEDMGGEALKLAMTREMSDRRVWVLLDGIDEEPDYYRRLQLVRAVDEFILNCPDCQCVVTSRPVGYIRLKGEVPHYMLTPFDNDQREQFIRSWRIAREWRRKAGDVDLSQVDTELAHDLIAVTRNQQINELSRNPLVLVMLLFLLSAGVRLPEQRVELYERVVDLLIGTWNVVRSSLPVEPGQLLDQVDLRRVVAASALSMKRSRPSGVIEERELRAALAAILVEMELDEEAPEKTAGLYLQAAAKQAGLLEEDAPGLFSFWHQSFAEYLAAVELVRDPASAAQDLMAVRDDPVWFEVVSMAVSELSYRQPDVAGRLLVTLADEGFPGDEPVIHGALAVVVSCLSDRPRVRRSTKELLIGRLVSALNMHPRHELALVLDRVVGALYDFTPKEATTIEALIELTHSPYARARLPACRLLGRAMAHHESAAKCLPGQPRRDVWEVCAVQASLYLHCAGQLDQSELNADIARLSDRPIGYEAPDLSTVAPLLTALDAPTEAVRFGAAALLFETEHRERARAVLETLARGATVPRVRYRAQQVLGPQPKERLSDDDRSNALELLACDDYAVRVEVAGDLAEGELEAAATTSLVEVLAAPPPGEGGAGAGTDTWYDEEWYDDAVSLLAGRHLSLDSISALRARMISAADMGAIRAASVLIGTSEHESAIATLEQFLFAEDWQMRFEAAAALLPTEKQQNAITTMSALADQQAGRWWRVYRSMLDAAEAEGGAGLAEAATEALAAGSDALRRVIELVEASPSLQTDSGRSVPAWLKVLVESGVDIAPVVDMLEWLVDGDSPSPDFLAVSKTLSVIGDGPVVSRAKERLLTSLGELRQAPRAGLGWDLSG